MTYAEQIRATAERACGAVAQIQPDPLQWAEARGLQTTLTLHNYGVHLNVHGLHLPIAETTALLHETFPVFYVEQAAYGKTQWAVGSIDIDDLTVQISVFAGENP